MIRILERHGERLRRNIPFPWGLRTCSGKKHFSPYDNSSMLERYKRMQVLLDYDSITAKLVRLRRWRAILQTALLGMLAIAVALRALPLDKTKPEWPKLSTSHGPLKFGATIKDEIQGDADLLLTDMPMTDGELQRAHDSLGVNLLHVATAVTGVVPCYHLEGVKDPLNFSPAVLAAIFLGKITKWNDPAIVSLNPSVHLPASEIIIFGHGQEDGSTYAMTDFLAKTSEVWRRSVGKVRSLFDLPILLQARTQEDIQDLIKQTPNSFSYIELWVAKGNGIQFGRIRNRGGRYIGASPESITAAAQSASPYIGNDFRASITDTAGSGDYPIASFTWAVIPDKFDDAEKRAVILSFLRFVLTDGQGSSDSMHFGRLPRAVADRELRMLTLVN